MGGTVGGEFSERVQEIQALFVDRTRSARTPLFESTLQLEKQPHMRIEMSVCKELKAFEPERVYREGLVAPAIVEDVLVNGAKLAAK